MTFAKNWTLSYVRNVCFLKKKKEGSFGSCPFKISVAQYCLNMKGLLHAFCKKV